MKLGKSAEAARLAAKEHFARVRQMPSIFEMSGSEAAEHEELGTALLEASLALEEGQYLGLSELLREVAGTDERKRIALKALPFVAHSLGLLEMEFCDASGGIVPVDVVRRLVVGDGQVEWRGVPVTSASVMVRYRRI